jgi:predicted transcriptional regulator
MTTGNEDTNKSAAKLAWRLERTADMYRRGVVPAIIALELGISRVTLNSYLKQLAARGEITLRQRPRKEDDPVAQLLARAKKRGISKSEREKLLEDIGGLFNEREETRKNRDKSALLPATRATLEKALEELQRQVAAQQDQQQKPTTDRRRITDSWPETSGHAKE